MSLLIATPMYGGQCTSRYWRSTVHLENILTRIGLVHTWLETTNESLITRGRNTIATRFLKRDEDRLFFIDSDIEFDPEHAATLWNMDADVAVGCYPMKKLGAHYAAWINGKLLKLDDLEKREEPFPVDYAGTGFMMIHRRVFERLREAHPEWRYIEGNMGEDKGEGECWAFFQDPIEDGIHLSEDYFFCKRAREIGFQVMMHPKVRLKHWGAHCFDGT